MVYNTAHQSMVPIPGTAMTAPHIPISQSHHQLHHQEEYAPFSEQQQQQVNTCTSNSHCLVTAQSLSYSSHDQQSYGQYLIGGTN
ncbi:hypothetical protein AB6A40_000707 [Gnathostoma spinigerum]|uniref:Uncharacterized protein n=1 Tax=Gnathostoma spinigerum TaxID=75299 RepID=A0ABD6E2P9_9BILA